MQACAQKFTLVFITLCIFLSAQSIPAQEKSDHITLNEIKSKLAAILKDGSDPGPITGRVADEIRRRKVDFVLTAEDREFFRNFTGNDLINEAIENNVSAKALEIEAQRLYQIFVDNYRGDAGQKQLAVKAAREFIERFENDPDLKAQIDYLKKVVPKLEAIDTWESDTRNLYSKFDEALKEERWEDLYVAGAEILKREPDFVDVSLVLAAVGFENKNSRGIYPEQTVFYAEKSIELLEANTKSRTNRYGVLKYTYDDKPNALGWMNYIIGYLKYYQLDQKDEAIGYFNKAKTYRSEARALALNQLSSMN